ncbi:MAG: UDP-N-acetylmuramoyl-L-alanyl-D-glutamate--2,6-diaminopimelate ligase, partial [Gammaproteobacteria bacterium]|nr:UDP-N-acetylmuramoyl-L-alanyl-D-glutamate--2,6-diaminopimelate ligase [Gammaproteobacteria bacterium]
TLGTLGYGLPGREVPASHTTPDVVSVHRWLANMARQGAKAVAMEVSSHALTQGRVEGVHFDVAVFTNLTRDHLDYHGSMEAYGEAKRALFDAHRPRYAVINVDDPFGVQLSARLAGEMQVVRTSLQASEAELFVQRLECTAEGLLMACAGRWGAFELNVPLMGRFNAMNVLQAVASVLVCEIPLDVVVQAVRQLQAPPGRLQQFIFPQGLRVVVDYAHTPDALANALGALRAHCHGRLRCVFGCGGDRDAGKRPEMGRVAAEMADDVILTDDNPRSEMPENIVAQILTGIASRDLIRVQHDREQAIRDALRDAGPDDIVLIAGKGHEDYQEVTGVRRPFSDIAVVQTCLQELSA